jgi:hypothetical protein
MITSAFDDDDVVPLRASRPQSVSPLRGLMRDWERDATVDEDESETELMVLLSGMVGVSGSAAGDL